jgi:hypothetical protein
MTMPKLKNLAALAAAIEAARRYARSNPDKAAKYLDQAAAFIDKQTKGKYSSKIDGVAQQVKGAAGLPKSSGTQGYGTNPGYGAHQGYGASAVAPDPLTTTTTSPSTPPSSTTASSTTAPLSTPATADPQRTGDQHFPGSKDL